MDQYLSFVAPSPSLFSLLPLPAQADTSSATGVSVPSTPQEITSYTILNSPSSTEQQIEEEIERVANGLFSAVATLGSSHESLRLSLDLIPALGHVPFIRAPRGNAAEMVAKKLEVKIRDAILTASRSTNPSNALFAPDSTGLSSLQRPRVLHLSLILAQPSDHQISSPDSRP